MAQTDVNFLRAFHYIGFVSFHNNVSKLLNGYSSEDDLTDSLACKSLRQHGVTFKTIIMQQLCGLLKDS